MSAGAFLSTSLPPHSNKYTRGSLLVLAGSSRYFGAGVLAAQAAARSGAGYVTLATPGSAAAAAARAHLLTVPVFEAKDCEGTFAPDALDDIVATIKHYDAIILGCGITVSASSAKFVACVIHHAVLRGLPLLLDADALNILAQQPGLLPVRPTNQQPTAPLNQQPAQSSSQPADSRTNAYPAQQLTLPVNSSAQENTPVVLTPHAGELKRLLAAYGLDDADDGRQLAQILEAVVVAKGHRTRVSGPAGSDSGSGLDPSSNSNSNSKGSILMSAATPALATAGTGDVLSGIIGALLAQRLLPFEAAQTGVELHSRAGSLAAEHVGEHSVIATDVIDALPGAFKQFVL
ncbi:MAG: NAD(P)H-hydrate dehydratase [Coriobacteriales bacterium]|jgi:NAD(P)H-hydrate epimerase|nr:NAD(P)H-hydrate dehydratase [Coriobacteriales bacterium]